MSVIFIPEIDDLYNQFYSMICINFSDLFLLDFPWDYGS